MPAPMSSPAPILIVGSGLAAYTLARELRKLDAAVPLRIISQEVADSYYKPALSNAFASQKSAAQLVLKNVAQMAQDLRAEIVQGEVLALTPAARRVQVRLASGETMDWAYHKLVLAVGASPFIPAMKGDGAPAVMMVNTLADYAQFRTAVARCAEQKKASRSTAGEPVRIVLLGAGLIGCEFANDLSASGIQVQVVDLAEWPVARLLPREAGMYLAEKLQTLGVQFHFQTSVQRLDRKVAVGKVAAGKAPSSFQIDLGYGRVLEADIVLSAVGLRPNLALAQAAGLKTGQGIIVDTRLCSSDPHIHALGDCAEVAGHVLPFVQPILQAAKPLAAILLGQPGAVHYPCMPVVVKTPVCPTIVAPPPLGSTGNWQVKQEVDGIEARFVDAANRLLGFALLGAAATRPRQTALATECSDLLPATATTVLKSPPPSLPRLATTEDPLRVGLLSISDRAAQGIYQDQGLPALRNWLQEVLASPWQVEEWLVADEQAEIETHLRDLVDTLGCHLVLTTGGTGPALRDVTPEATLAVADRVLPGFGEQMRAVSLRHVPTAILSRQMGVVRKKALILNLPGQPKAIRETLDGVFPAVPYCLELIGAPCVRTHAEVMTAFRPQSAPPLPVDPAGQYEEPFP